MILTASGRNLIWTGLNKDGNVAADEVKEVKSLVYHVASGAQDLVSSPHFHFVLLLFSYWLHSLTDFFTHGDKMAASTSKLPSGPLSTSMEKEKSVPLKVPELNPIGSDRAGLSSRAYIRTNHCIQDCVNFLSLL